MAIEQAPPIPQSVHPQELNTVTQRMAALIHLNGAFNEFVHGALVRPTEKTLAPNWKHIDAVHLARHSTQERNRRGRRDVNLFMVLCFMIVGLFAGVLFFFFGDFGAMQFVRWEIAVLVLTYVGAFSLVWRHYWQIQNSALYVFGDGPGANLDGSTDLRDYVVVDEPKPNAAVVEDFLKESEEANLVFFDGGQPFPGSGELIFHWNLSIDRSRSKWDGLEPKAFSTTDLHEFLAADIMKGLEAEDLAPEPGRAAREPGAPRDPDDPWPSKHPQPLRDQGVRLYVMSDYADDIPGILRAGAISGDDGAWTRWRRFRTRMPEEFLRRYIAQPVFYARPYQYFTLSYPNGQLIVTMFVRVEVRKADVFVEVNICSIRPLASAFSEIWSIPVDISARRLAMLRTVAPVAWDLMIRSPRPVINLARKPHRDHLNERKRWLQIQNKRDVDYGPGRSLREEVARGNLGAHYMWIDEEQWFRVLNRRALTSIGRFLEMHNVHPDEFKTQADELSRNWIEHARKLYQLKPEK